MTRVGKTYARIFLAVMVVMLVVPAFAQVSQFTDDNYFRRALDPFWRTNNMRESVLFLQPSGANLQGKAAWPQSKLLFLPDAVLTVNSTDHRVTYQQGRDYVVDTQTGTLFLPPSSRIPFKTLNQLYPKLTDGDATNPVISKTGDLTRGVLFGENGLYQSLQVEVNYTLTPGQWSGYIPQFASTNLPKTLAKLKAGQQIKVFIIGDSISQGYSSSKWEVTTPFQPPYQELVAGALQAAYHGALPVV